MKNREIANIKRIIEAKKDKLTKEFKIREMILFGSYTQGKTKKKSDIDIIVDFEETPTFLKFVKIREKLSKIFGRKVDLLTKDSISPYIKPYLTKIRIL